MNRTATKLRLLAALSLILMMAGSARAQQGAGASHAPIPAVSITIPATAPPLRGAKGEEVRSTVFDLDLGEAHRLRSAGAGRVSLDLPGRGVVDLVLQETEILARDAQVTVTGPGGPVDVPVDLEVFRGHVEGDPSAWAVIGIAGRTLFGSVLASDGAWAILPPGIMKGETHHRILNESDLPLPLRDLTCGVDDDPLGWPRMSDLDKGAEAGPAVTNTRLLCNIAVDADYEFFALFGTNLSLATNYALTLMATVSAIYERDVNVTLSVSYLNFWGNPTDPYNQTDGAAQLNEFRTYWQTNMSGVGRNLAMLLSGRNYSGVAGIAYLNGLCSTNIGYSLVSIPQPVETYPTNQVNFNTALVAHELGHNFGSPHTHSCYWQSAGFVAPGALIDSCNTAEGNCYNGPIHTAFGKGTIMSYCHLLGPASSTIRLDFHPHCITVMRAASEGSCFIAAPVQPPTNLAIVEGVDGPRLTWTASTTPGVVRYEIHASIYTLDHNPPFLDSTNVTQLEPLPSGTYYFKIRALHPSVGYSPFSSEVRASGCNYLGVDSAVNLPQQMITADFDEDGIPDLAMIAQNPRVVAIMRGQGSGGVGNGTFAAPVTYTAGPAPTNLATDDFNDDGILDLAVTSWATVSGSPGTLQILLGLGTAGVGNGTFGAATSFPAYRDPSNVVTADFNEDGIVDVAASGGFPGKVSIFLGLGSAGVGTGSFGAATHLLSLGNRPRGLAVADMNQDDIFDLVVTYRGPASDNEARLTALIGQGSAGNGNGAFVEDGIYGVAASRVVNVYDMAIADFNADGNLDVAVAADTQGTSGLIPRVAIALGNPPGSFALFGIGNSFEVGGQSLLGMDVADWNQDGIADVMATNNEVDEIPSVALLYGGGSAGVANGMLGTPLRFGTGGNEGKDLIGGDFDEDGVPDAAVSLASRISMLKSVCAVNAEGSLALTSPVGGEAWLLGDERTITWTKGTGVLTVDIQVSRDSGQNWETVARDIIGTSFTWSVTEPATIHARVRVVDSTLPHRQDASDLDFYIGTTSAVGGDPPTDATFRVAGVHPNPFRSAVTLAVSVPAAGDVEFVVVDVLGRVVRRQSLTASSAGPLDLVWDGRNDQGGIAPSGVYYTRVAFAGRVLGRTVTLVR
jgi:hypothetical protein